MSELMDELKSSLEGSSQNLEKLISDIQGMADSENEFSELKDSLSKAAQALSSNAEKYEIFLSELRNSNEKFKDTLTTLKSLEPEEIKDQLAHLSKLVQQLNINIESIQGSVSQILEAIELGSKENKKLSETLLNLHNAQSEKLASLEKRLNSRTALIPVIFFGLLALAVAILLALAVAILFV